VTMVLGTSPPASSRADFFGATKGLAGVGSACVGKNTGTGIAGSGSPMGFSIGEKGDTGEFVLSDDEVVSVLVDTANNGADVFGFGSSCPAVAVVLDAGKAKSGAGVDFGSSCSDFSVFCVANRAKSEAGSNLGSSSSCSGFDVLSVLDMANNGAGADFGVSASDEFVAAVDRAKSGTGAGFRFSASSVGVDSFLDIWNIGAGAGFGATAACGV
jgi:hypothetical protein